MSLERIKPKGYEVRFVETPHFSQINDEIIRQKDLPDNAFRVYTLLHTYAKYKDYCWPTEETMANELGHKRNYIAKALRILKNKELIVVQIRGLNRSNLIFIALKPMSKNQVERLNRAGCIQTDTSRSIKMDTHNNSKGKDTITEKIKNEHKPDRPQPTKEEIKHFAETARKKKEVDGKEKGFNDYKNSIIKNPDPEALPDTPKYSRQRELAQEAIALTGSLLSLGHCTQS